MKKKEYIDAINEIEVDEKLKRKTLEKVLQKKSYKKTQSIRIVFSLYKQKNMIVLS